MKVFFLLIFIISSSSYGKPICNLNFFAEEISEENVQSLFESYLKYLVDEKILDSEIIDEFVARLEVEQLMNPFSLMSFSKEVELHEKIFQDYIDSELLDLERVRSFLRRVQQKEGKERVERKVIEEEFESPYLPIEFGVIGPNDGHLDYSFETMTIPVTESHWSQVFGKELRQLKRELIHSDLPKVDISAYSQMVFADRLSQQKGFQSVFNLGLNQEEVKQAAMGELYIPDDLHFLFQGNYLEQEGYRLPTKTERAIMVIKMYSSLGKEHFLFNRSKYASYNIRERQLIGGTNPVNINGRDFYDLLGNIEESHFDDLSFSENTGVTKMSLCYVSGGIKKTYGASLLGNQAGCSHRSDIMGFRLVRTLK